MMKKCWIWNINGTYDELTITGKDGSLKPPTYICKDEGGETHFVHKAMAHKTKLKAIESYIKWLNDLISKNMREITCFNIKSDGNIDLNNLWIAENLLELAERQLTALRIALNDKKKEED